MRWTSILLAGLLTSCGGADHGYIVEGVVVDKTSATQIVVDHEEVKGLMGPMVMPFEAKDAAVFEGVKPGDRIVAKLHLAQDGSWITKLRVTGHGVVPEAAKREAEANAMPALKPGAMFPATPLTTVGGASLLVGEGQARPTLLTFQYTTCPLPEFCPATTRRLQSFQAALGADAQLVSVTLDPEGDTDEVLAAYASQAGANPASWVFVRPTTAQLATLAERSGLGFTLQSGEIMHGIRWMVLDKRGRLVERYDDNNLPLERVVTQLRTGEPLPAPGSVGTFTPKPVPSN